MAKILYFAQFVKLLGSDSAEVTLADAVVRVTIDRQFGDIDSALSDANEIALINSRRL